MSSEVKTFLHQVVFNKKKKKCFAQKPDTESDVNIHNTRVNKSWKQDQSDVSYPHVLQVVFQDVSGPVW